MFGVETYGFRGPVCRSFGSEGKVPWWEGTMHRLAFNSATFHQISECHHGSLKIETLTRTRNQKYTQVQFKFILLPCVNTYTQCQLALQTQVDVRGMFIVERQSSSHKLVILSRYLRDTKHIASSTTFNTLYFPYSDLYLH